MTKSDIGIGIGAMLLVFALMGYAPARGNRSFSPLEQAAGAVGAGVLTAGLLHRTKRFRY